MAQAGAVCYGPVMIVSRRAAVTIVSAIAACGLLGWLQRATNVAPKGALVAVLYPPYGNEAAMAWRVQHMLPLDMTALRRFPADDPTDENDRRSPVMIYEEGRPLGPAHSNFADISKLGHGRFAHWTDQGLIFSTSDGTDPNRNGRRYWAVVP